MVNNCYPFHYLTSARQRREAIVFKLTQNVRVKRDDQGIVRHLNYLQEPYAAPSGVTPTARGVAEAYVRDVGDIYSIDPKMLSTLYERVERELKKEPSRLRSLEEKRLLNSTVLGYQQTLLGLPVWEAHFTVRMHEDPVRVTSSDSSVHHDIKVEAPPKNAKYLPGSDQVEELLHELLRGAKGKLVKITEQRLLVYRYDSDRRFDPEAGREEQGTTLEGRVPTLPLPKVAGTIEPGSYYVVNEVLFTTALGPWKALHWRTMIEVKTGAVLYLRAFVTAAFGNVFSVDPVTLTGDTSLTPCSPGTDLDPITDLVTLVGLTPPAAGDQELASDFVTLGELSTAMGSSG